MLYGGVSIGNIDNWIPIWYFMFVHLPVYGNWNKIKQIKWIHETQTITMGEVFFHTKFLSHNLNLNIIFQIKIQGNFK